MRNDIICKFLIIFTVSVMASGCSPELNAINKYLSDKGIDKISGTDHGEIVDNTYKMLYSSGYFSGPDTSRHDRAERISNFISATGSYDVLIHLIDYAFENLDPYYQQNVARISNNNAFDTAVDASILSLIKISVLPEKPVNVFSHLNDLIQKSTGIYNDNRTLPDEDIVYYHWHSLLYYISALVLNDNSPEILKEYYPVAYEQLNDNYPYFNDLKSDIHEFVKMVSGNPYFAKYGLKRSFPADENILKNITFNPQKGAYVIIFDDSKFLPLVSNIFTEDDSVVSYIPDPDGYRTDFLYPASDPSTASLIIYENYSYTEHKYYADFAYGGSKEIYSRDTRIRVVDSVTNEIFFEHTYKTELSDSYSFGNKERYRIIDDYQPGQHKAEIEKLCLPVNP